VNPATDKATGVTGASTGIGRASAYALPASLSYAWLKRYRLGPLECLWRCGTYWQRLPLRKQDRSVAGAGLNRCRSDLRAGRAE
jgi:hypothetical protein